MSAWEEIERSLRRNWRRSLVSRIYSRWIWSAPALLLAWTLFIHLALRAGWWQPAPAQVLYGAMLALILATAWALWALRSQSFLRFLRRFELEKGEIGLRAWWGMSRSREEVPVEGLFLDALRRRLDATPPAQMARFSMPRLSRLLFIASALGLLFLLLPWGGGLGSGIAPRPSAETETTTAKSGQIEPQPSKAIPQPRPQRTKQTANPDRRAEPKPHAVDPKYVPAREGEGSKSWKETLLYDLPTPGEEGVPTLGANSIASSIEKWKRIAEETIRKEKLDAEEARLVARYFDKLRP